jgi:hypothetical protein
MVRLLAGALASSLLTADALAQSSPGATTAQPAPGAVKPGVAAASGAKALAPALGVPRSQHAERYYAVRYGVDSLRIRSVSSGASLEFRYRVVDPEKARLLGDKNAKPAIVDWKTGARLTVPTMEQIGQLRQQATKLEPGREYWMVFANSGKLVKLGDKVDVVVGPMHFEGLIVE